MFNHTGFGNVIATSYASESWIFVIITPERYTTIQKWVIATYTMNASTPLFHKTPHNTVIASLGNRKLGNGHWWLQFAQSLCGDTHLPHLSHWSVSWPTAFSCFYEHGCYCDAKSTLGLSMVFDLRIVVSFLPPQWVSSPVISRLMPFSVTIRWWLPAVFSVRCGGPFSMDSNLVISAFF